MDAQELRGQMFEAFELQGFEGLTALVESLRAAGVSKETLLAGLNLVRLAVSEGDEDVVLDVMDLLEGWCAPSARID